MLDDEALTELVGTVIRRQVPDAVVGTVAVKPDLDHDGDDTPRVTVVLKKGVKRLDPATVVDTLGRLWPELGEAGIESFPIVSYMTKADAARLKRESV